MLSDATSAAEQKCHHPDVDALADFIARHVPIVLGVVTLVTWLAAAVFWRLIGRFGPASWTLAVKVWNAVRATRAANWVRDMPVLGHVISGTLTAARYLGIVAVLGFALAAGAIVMFFELAEQIGVGESLATFDDALSRALSEHASLATLRVFSAITHLGDFAFLGTLVVCVFVLLLIRRQWLLAGAWLVGTASGGLLNRLLKAIFERTRPVHEHGIAAATGWSFPSGHASAAMLVYGLLVYLIVRHTRPAWHIPVALAGIGLIVFVGASRIVLQVHYLSDVLAGWVCGAAWVAICIAGLEAARWREAQNGRLQR